MADTGTITLPRAEYDALIARNEELEDRLAALDADDGSRIPHDVAACHHARREPCGRIPQSSRHYVARSVQKNRGRRELPLGGIERGSQAQAPQQRWPGSPMRLARRLIPWWPSLDLRQCRWEG